MAIWRKGPKLGTVFEERSPDEDTPGDDGVIPKHGQLAPADAHRTVQPGELTLEEDAAGGMGRHLGLFSTTFLMYDTWLDHDFLQRR